MLQMVNIMLMNVPITHVSPQVGSSFVRVMNMTRTRRPLSQSKANHLLAND